MWRPSWLFCELPPLLKVIVLATVLAGSVGVLAAALVVST